MWYNSLIRFITEKGRNELFTYIKPEFMIHAFLQQRDTLLNGRSICVARLGEFSISMTKVDEDTFSLSLENVETGSQHSGKIFNIKNTDHSEIVPLVNELFHKMQNLNEKQIFDHREDIWKWYAMSWLEEQDISLNDYLESRMLGTGIDEYAHWKSFEEYMSVDYLNVASTMNIIDRFASSEEEKKEYKAFAAKDIVELRQRQTLENIREKYPDGEEAEVRKAYSFGIDVVAESRAQAKEKLMNALKNFSDGEFYIRG